MSNSSPIVGIDLGTTHSLVAFTRGGRPEVLISREGRRLIPSIVSFVDGEPVIGYAAKARKIVDAEHTVFSVKRLLGRGYDDLKEASGRLPYRIVPGDSSGQGTVQDSVARIEIEGRKYTAIEISAMILREVRSAAESALGETVTRAVLTVPAYFNDAQRQATRAAGRLAGLEIVRIVNEPTAAALAYGLDRKRQGLIAVYDLGGGTFDLSILRLRDGIFEVLATHGNTSLGGDDLDRAIALVAAQEIEEKFGVKPFENRHQTAALIDESENIKIALSNHESATLNIMIDAAKGRHYSRVFTRSEFEALARPVLEPTRKACELALRDAGLKASDISDVVLVGGPTRLKVIQDFVKEIFGREPNTSVHPDEVVALGAAIQADILAGNNQDLLLLDVVPLSLGIETYGGLMSPLIKRNTRIPTAAHESFTTYADRQTGVDIHVLQGERDRVEDNRSLARFKLSGIMPMPAGLPRIEVTFLIDADGILQVAAKDMKTGHEQSIEVRPSFGLTEDEIQKMLDASLKNQSSDESYRKLVAARQDADPVLRGCEKNMEAAFRLLPESEAKKIETRVGGLKRALKQDDPEEIRQAAFQLDQASRKLADLLVGEVLKEN